MTLSDRIKTALLLLCVVCLSLVGLEAMFRFVSGAPIFSTANFRKLYVVQNGIRGGLRYDPLLGWVHKDGVRSRADGRQFHTIEHGIRRNSADDTKVRTGGVLVVGASFTAGAEASDEEAWPAQLEQIIRSPVINAGVGGYGVDQMVLRAEQMIPIAKPHTVIVNIVDGNIETTGYSYSGRPKPYFLVSNGKLVAKNNPVPTFYQLGKSPYKDFFGHFFVVDRIMATFFRDYWYSSGAQNFQRANADPGIVSCLMLQRLRERAAKSNIRVLVNLQHGGGQMSVWKRLPNLTLQVEDCARKMGIEVLDEFDYLRNLISTDMQEFRSLYVSRPGGVFGHKTAKGNLKVAQTVAAALETKHAPSGLTADSFRLEQDIPGDGKNLIPHNGDLSKLFRSNTSATIQQLSDEKSEPVYRVAAAGGATEHYLRGAIDPYDGPLIFSLYVKNDTTSKIRIQLLNGEPDGIVASVNLTATDSNPYSVGRAQHLQTSVSLADGWYHVWASANFPPSEKPLALTVQLANANGKYSFAPNGEAILIRSLRVERGNVPAPAVR